jgi:hypothetical protein
VTGVIELTQRFLKTSNPPLFKNRQNHSLTQKNSVGRGPFTDSTPLGCNGGASLTVPTGSTVLTSTGRMLLANDKQYPPLCCICQGFVAVLRTFLIL